MFIDLNGFLVSDVAHGPLAKIMSPILLQSIIISFAKVFLLVVLPECAKRLHYWQYNFSASKQQA